MTLRTLAALCPLCARWALHMGAHAGSIPSMQTAQDVRGATAGMQARLSEPVLAELLRESTLDAGHAQPLLAHACAAPIRATAPAGHPGPGQASSALNASAALRLTPNLAPNWAAPHAPRCLACMSRQRGRGAMHHGPPHHKESLRACPAAARTAGRASDPFLPRCSPCSPLPPARTLRPHRRVSARRQVSPAWPLRQIQRNTA